MISVTISQIVTQAESFKMTYLIKKKIENALIKD